MACDLDSAKWRENLDLFESAVRAYVSFVAGLTEGRPKPFYRTLHRLLSDLAHSERFLDFAPHMYEEAPQSENWRDFHQARWKELETMFCDLLKPDVDIRGSDDDFESRKHMLGNDLAELYLDLNEGLEIRALDHPNAAENAAWEWRFKYGHWGDHLFRALWTIHQIRCWSGINAEQTEDENPGRREAFLKKLQEGTL